MLNKESTNEVRYTVGPTNTCDTQPLVLVGAVEGGWLSDNQCPSTAPTSTSGDICLCSDSL